VPGQDNIQCWSMQLGALTVPLDAHAVEKPVVEWVGTTSGSDGEWSEDSTVGESAGPASVNGSAVLEILGGAVGLLVDQQRAVIGLDDRRWNAEADKLLARAERYWGKLATSPDSATISQLALGLDLPVRN
jgi:hypothetical protein